MSSLPDIKIGGCYIPPPDSPYFDESSFAKIQEHCMDTKTQSIVIGDLNARCGKAVCMLEKSDCNYSQQALPDPLIRPQSNGNSILQLCKDTDMLILNNLIYRGDTRRFKSKLTYRKGQEFISELDLCLANYEALPLLESLMVSEEQLPSDHLHVLLCITIDTSKSRTYDMEELLKSAKGLGQHAVLNTQKSTKYMNVNTDLFRQKLLEKQLPLEINPADIAGIMYNMAQECTTQEDVNSNNEEQHTSENKKNRWNYMLSNKDNREIWNAINWKGEVKSCQSEKPKSEDFKHQFEKLLNPEEMDVADMPRLMSNIQIPILDDPISPNEVKEVISRQIKSDKGSGPDGLAPSLFKMLPIQWIFLLVNIFTTVLRNGYPNEWRYAKIVTIFKKGAFNMCDNYRGISIMDCIPKTYDYILCNRLSTWFIPDREQAFAQAKLAVWNILSVYFY